MLSAPHASAIERNTSLHIHYRLDKGMMDEAAAAVLGTHDFAAFMASGRPVDDTRRTIYCSEWHQSGERLDYTVEGSGFLYNMVRILAGTMLDIGMGRLEPDAMRKALESGQRGDAGPTAPAHGLTLVRVVYDDFDSGNYISQQ
ncbi:tRNA pseudouridine synthase A [bioreactor metagenome]|uniref:tRNA pseudouridine synthase A n=1 Tax=bioreactor metagenome TaxID=1076179 RepID=A0A645HZM4_9ZZZZ